LRFLMASLFWLPAFAKAWRVLPVRDRASLAFLSFLMLPGTFLLQFVGLWYTSASSAALMIGFEPLMIVLLGHFFWRERARALDLGLGVIALLGVCLVMGWPRGAHFRGCLLVFLSTGVVAVWVRWSKAWLRRLDASAFSALVTVLGTAPLFLLLPLFPGSWRIAWTPGFIAVILYLGLGCSLAAGWLWNRGLGGVRANAGGFFLALEPVFGVLFAALLLGERMRGVALCGAFLVLLSVVLSMAAPLWEKPRDA
jgi:drug/metabolite transporter (DMT)-like permease